MVNSIWSYPRRAALRYAHIAEPVFTEAASQLRVLQDKVKVPSAQRIVLTVVQRLPAFAVSGRPTRAHAGFLLLLVIVGSAFYSRLRRPNAPALAHRVSAVSYVGAAP